jgi:hypothetical protein
MPCVGPSDDEIRDYERVTNKREVGKAWTDYECAVNAACAFWKHVRRGEAIPAWVIRWGERHDMQDAEKAKLAEHRKRKEKEEDELEFERLRQKLGK